MPTGRSIWEEADEIDILCLKIKSKKDRTERNYEEIRRRYDPRKQGKEIKVLFIGESPPGKTFFYCANSKLYYATKKAFELAYGKVIPDPDFLECFKHLGCYLIDFFNEQANKNVDSYCQDFKDQMNYIINQIKEINPKFIIVVHERVCYCVMLALLKANLKIEVRCLPFPRGTLRNCRYIPNAWGRAYIHQLVEIIQKELIPRGIFPERLPQPPC